MNLTIPARAVLFFSSACFSAVASGCGAGDGKADVSGTIKVRAKAPSMAGLQISFMGRDGALVTAPIAEDGTYKAANVSAGENKVGFIFITKDAVREGADAKSGGSRMKKPGGKAEQAEKYAAYKEAAKNPIPVALRDPSTSNLSVTVETGKNNVFDHDLQP
ncbi:MAG TPA: hypothetical protein VH092_03830 [Urbifossiella sp.]|jgi:hypothetical protein|nr:hypothetical protein [Urbifossiella sp.]